MKIENVKIDNRTFLSAAKDFLAKAPADEVYTLAELSAAIGRPIPTTCTYNKRLLADHAVKATVNSRHQWLFGSPAALKALRAKLQTK